MTPDTLDAEALRTRVADLLAASRARSTALTDAVDEADLVTQHSPLMSPLVWDLAHIGSLGGALLVRDVGGREPLRPEIRRALRRVPALAGQPRGAAAAHPGRDARLRRRGAGQGADALGRSPLRGAGWRSTGSRSA